AGLYASFAAGTIAPRLRAYEPRYALWADGLAKRRWLDLPAGQKIDTSDGDHWGFPVGTRFWKEVATAGGARLAAAPLGNDGAGGGGGSGSSAGAPTAPTPTGRPRARRTSAARTTTSRPRSSASAATSARTTASSASRRSSSAPPPSPSSSPPGW